jgi:hypothetical protein
MMTRECELRGKHGIANSQAGSCSDIPGDLNLWHTWEMRASLRGAWQTRSLHTTEITPCGYDERKSPPYPVRGLFLGQISCTHGSLEFRDTMGSPPKMRSRNIRSGKGNSELAGRVRADASSQANLGRLVGRCRNVGGGGFMHGQPAG